MKNKVRNILTICIVLLSILTSSCGEKQFIDKDESAKQEIIKRFIESPVYSLTNDEVIKAFSGSFRERYDEFQKINIYSYYYECIKQPYQPSVTVSNTGDVTA